MNSSDLEKALTEASRAGTVIFIPKGIANQPMAFNDGQKTLTVPHNSRDWWKLYIPLSAGIEGLQTALGVDG
jgi:hypothetical protein